MLRQNLFVRKTSLSESARYFFYPNDTWSWIERSDWWSIHNFYDKKGKRKMQTQAIKIGWERTMFLLYDLLSCSEMQQLC